VAFGGDAMIRVIRDASKLKAAAEKLPKALKFNFGDALDHISLKFLKKFRAERLSGPFGTRIVGRPRGIFSQFKRSFLIPSGTQTMGVEIRSDSEIAKLHEEGGVVRNPSGGKLAVPLRARTELFTGTGALRKQYKNVRALKNVVPIRFNNQTFLTRVRKKSRDILPLFVLKSQVKIPPRLGFYQTWEDMEKDAFAIVDKAVIRAAKEAWN